MKARRLIECSTYGPVTLAVLYKALDDAWAEIAHKFVVERRRTVAPGARPACRCPRR